MMNLLCLVSLALVSVFGQHHHGTSVCTYIASADCSIFAEHKLCATDAITYLSKCAFSKAHCLEPNLHVSHTGVCDPSVDKPDPTLHGQDLTYQFFCANLKHQKCGTDLEIVCGSDMVTYDNLCLYEQARCSIPTLTIHKYQACP